MARRICTHRLSAPRVCKQNKAWCYDRPCRSQPNGRPVSLTCGHSDSNTSISSPEKWATASIDENVTEHSLCLSTHVHSENRVACQVTGFVIFSLGWQMFYSCICYKNFLTNEQTRDRIFIVISLKRLITAQVLLNLFSNSWKDPWNSESPIIQHSRVAEKVLNSLRELSSPEPPDRRLFTSELVQPRFLHSLLFELLQKADLTDTGFSAILIRGAMIWQGCQ